MKSSSSTPGSDLNAGSFFKEKVSGVVVNNLVSASGEGVVALCQCCLDSVT